MKPSQSTAPGEGAPAGLPPRLSAALLAWLAETEGEAGGWRLDLVQSRKFASGIRRALVRAVHQGSGRSVALKSNGAAAITRAEYAALDRLHRVMPDSVAPLHIDPGGRFLAMEWIDAPLTQDRLDGPDRDAALVRAGDWLGRLHRRSAVLPRSGGLFTPPRIPLWAGRGPARRAAALLRARLRGLSLRSDAPVMLHGDYQPGNIFDTGRRVIGFDRVRDHWGLPEFDIAKFLVAMAALRARAEEAGRPMPGDAESDRRRFFDGYGPLREADLARFDAIEDLIFFGKWAHYARRGLDRLDAEALARGLLGPARRTARPGRLVATPDGSTFWSGDPAPDAPPRGLAVRLRDAAGRLGSLHGGTSA